MAGKSPTDKAASALGFGAAAMLLCCGSHLLVVGVLGGLAVGTVLGVAAGVVALLVLVAAAVVVHRRRRAACVVPPARASLPSASLTSGETPAAAPASRESHPRETSHVA